MPREMSTVWPRWKLRTKTSDTGSGSPGARFDEVDWKATQPGRLCIDPSSEGFEESPVPCASDDDTLARTREPDWRAGRDWRSPSPPCCRLQATTYVRLLVLSH